MDRSGMGGGGGGARGREGSRLLCCTSVGLLIMYKKMYSHSSFGVWRFFLRLETRNETSALFLNIN